MTVTLVVSAGSLDRSTAGGRCRRRRTSRGPSFPDLFIVSSYAELADFSAGAKKTAALRVLAELAAATQVNSAAKQLQAVRKPGIREGEAPAEPNFCD